MRLLWLAIRLYPESAAARRLVIVSVLGLFCAAAGIAALVALVYRNSPAPQFVVPLIDLLIGMERPGTLLSVVGPTRSPWPSSTRSGPGWSTTARMKSKAAPCAGSWASPA